MDFREILINELGRVERQIREAQARAVVLRRTLAEYDRAGSSATPASGARSRKAGGATPGKAKAAARTRSQGRESSATGTPTKAARIREIIAARGSNGVTARDVMSRLGPKGAKGGINAIHAALSKLKKAKAVTTTGGKYFPTPVLAKR